jgi:hypothetical protein
MRITSIVSMPIELLALVTGQVAMSGRGLDAFGLELTGEPWRPVSRIQLTSWSSTNVNRSLAEGRAALRDRMARLEGG